MENYLTASDLALIENRRNYGYGENCGCGCGYGYRHRDGMAATGIGLAAGLGGAALLGVLAIGWGVNKASEARSNGAKHSGAYWSLEQAEEAMKKTQLPSDVNKYDFWVAINLSYSDLCKVLDDEQIIKSACAFWFKDEDWSNGNKSTTKVWDYMKCKYSK